VPLLFLGDALEELRDELAAFGGRALDPGLHQ
jgi:hypothetical protein